MSVVRCSSSLKEILHWLADELQIFMCWPLFQNLFFKVQTHFLSGIAEIDYLFYNAQTVCLE